MLIFRLEYEDRGIYVSGWEYSSDMADDHTDDSRRPSAYNLIYNSDAAKTCYCGFYSIAQLKKWFQRKWLKKMVEDNVQLKVYRLPSGAFHATDGCQVIFPKNECEVVGVFMVDDILNGTIKSKLLEVA